MREPFGQWRKLRVRLIVAAEQEGKRRPLTTPLGGNLRIALLRVPGISPGPGSRRKSIVSLIGLPGLALAGAILPPIDADGLSAAAGAAPTSSANAAAARARMRMGVIH